MVYVPFNGCCFKAFVGLKLGRFIYFFLFSIHFVIISSSSKHSSVATRINKYFVLFVFLTKQKRARHASHIQVT